MTDWLRIASDIKENYAKYDAFLVLHGTDTMAYTSSALSFVLKNLNKTVVVTGSQVPMSEQRNDGRENLLGALTIAGHFDIPEFSSPNMDPLASVAISIDVDWNSVMTNKGGKPLEVAKRLVDDVAILRLFPGITESTIRAFLSQPIKGVVLQTYGAGNAPDTREDLIQALKEATDRGVLIVNCTQCYKGHVAAHYATGTVLLKAGVIPGGDMTPEAALTKLSFVLAEYDSVEEQRKAIGTNLRGEITTKKNQHQFGVKDLGFIGAVSEALSCSTAKELELVRKGIAPILMCSAASLGNVEVLKNIKAEHNLHVDAADYDLRTALHVAAAEGHEELVRYLIREGANVHSKDRSGLTAIVDAVRAKHLGCISALREAGSLIPLDRRTQIATEMCALAAEDDVEAISCFIEAKADLNWCDYDKRTSLHVAAANGSLEVVKKLLDTPAVDVTAVDAFGSTPLAEAIKNGHKAVSSLLERLS
eukprot:UC4_evm3s1059